jgi:hypothetical protein
LQERGPVNAGVSPSPWIPDEVEPNGGWPPAPDAVPIVVSEWQPLRVGGGLVEAQAHPLARASYVVLRKHDHGLHRARRFAEAWRSLQQALDQGDPRRLGDPEYLEWLFAAGVLRPARRRASRRSNAIRR